MNIYDLIKQKWFKNLLCLITVILLASVIGIFIKASEQKNDISLIEYYRLTHIGILLLTALVISAISLFSCHYYNAYDIRNNPNRRNRDNIQGLVGYECTRRGDWVHRNIEYGIYIVSAILLISSISVYASTTEYLLYSESYYKRCTEGAYLLLASVSVFLVKYVYVFYKKYSSCTKPSDETHIPINTRQHIPISPYNPMEYVGNIPRPRLPDQPLAGISENTLGIMRNEELKRIEHEQRIQRISDKLRVR
jgi:hypothetical protein